jgi:hypothetical protein
LLSIRSCLQRILTSLSSRQKEWDAQIKFYLGPVFPFLLVPNIASFIGCLHILFVTGILIIHRTVINLVHTYHFYTPYRVSESGNRCTHCLKTHCKMSKKKKQNKILRVHPGSLCKKTILDAPIRQFTIFFFLFSFLFRHATKDVPFLQKFVCEHRMSGCIYRIFFRNF